MNKISKIPALDVSHLTVMYRNNVVLSDFTVTIPQGVMLGIIGPNGAGKTTFIKSILGLIPVYSGKIIILDKPINNVRNKITYVSQRSSIDWDFPVTVFDMVLMGCYGKLGWFKRASTSDYQKVHEALVMVGLETVAHNPISELSGGQQQRAFLARSLMQEADIYFLDEPFAGVDITTEKILIKLFKKLCQDGKTIIVVHHDLPTAPVYFDWILLLNKKCIACGPTEDILKAEFLQKTYGVLSVTHTLNFMNQRDGVL